MPEGPAPLPGRVTRVMDHLIMALRPSDASADAPPTFLLSLYWMSFDAGAGAGHLAFVVHEPAGAARREAILTDTPALHRLHGLALAPGQWPLRDPATPARAATFRREGLIDGVVYEITAADLHLTARFGGFGPPVRAHGPTRTPGRWISTALVEVTTPSAVLDGEEVSGQPFPNAIWTPWFGRPAGSCVAGLGEIIYELDEASTSPGRTA